MESNLAKSSEPKGGEEIIHTSRARKLFLASAALAVLAIFVLAPQVFLLFFCCVLFGVFLAALCLGLEHFTGLKRKWSLTMVVAALLILTGILVWLIGPQIASQFNDLSQRLPRALEQVREKLAASPLGKQALSFMPDGETLSRSGGSITKASSILSSTTGMLVYLVVIAFVGLYLAANPKVYVDGFARLFPAAKRGRVRHFLLECGKTLRRWLVGRLLLMTTNGIVTAVGLWLLGIPLPVTLGILSALLNFVPNLGPIIAAIPAVLIAFLEGPQKAMAVAIFYFAYQMFDGYVLTPLVQRRTVSLPPALTIMVQVLFGVLFGTMGVLVAVPFAAVGLIFVREIYHRDVLGANEARQ